MRTLLPHVALVATLIAVLIVPAQAEEDKKLTDEEFVRQATAGGLFEVKSAQFAMDQSTSDKVKKFARTLIEDHTKANQELAALATRKGIAVPAAMFQKHVDTLTKIGKLTGGKFDDEFASTQVDAHEATIKLFERMAKDGKDKDLKDWADKQLSTLKDHHKMARELAKSDEKKDKDSDKDKKDKDKDN